MSLNNTFHSEKTSGFSHFYMAFLRKEPFFVGEDKGLTLPSEEELRQIDFDDVLGLALTDAVEAMFEIHIKAIELDGIYYMIWKSDMVWRSDIEYQLLRVQPTIQWFVDTMASEFV